jgi:hypothetical protein
MENISALKTEYNKQVAALEKLRSGDLNKFEAELAKAGKAKVSVKNREEFLKEDEES